MMANTPFIPVGSVQAPLVAAAKKEPVAFWSLLAGLGNLLQLLAIPIAPWLHIVIAILSWIGATLAARSSATPNAAVEEKVDHKVDLKLAKDAEHLLK